MESSNSNVKSHPLNTSLAHLIGKYSVYSAVKPGANIKNGSILFRYNILLWLTYSITHKLKNPKAGQAP